MAVTPIALTATLPSELLNYILTQQSYPTTLIICQPRSTFLSALLEDINYNSRPRTHEANEGIHSPTAEDSETPPEKPLERHPLLIPTLRQIATSQHINLVFIPTLSHLRAYLVVFPPLPSTAGPPEQNFDRPGKREPLLVIYGLVGMHRDTSEWSAQGLGNTLSGLVDAGRRAGRKVVLLEERVGEDVDADLGEDLGGKRSKVSKVWDERLPMLNGSARRAGLETEDGGWSGRTVEVGRILGRWFKLRKGDWDIETY